MRCGDPIRTEHTQNIFEQEMRKGNGKGRMERAVKEEHQVMDVNKNYDDERWICTNDVVTGIHFMETM